MYDRTLQALVKSGMEPEWEAHFEPNSYDFRLVGQHMMPLKQSTLASNKNRNMCYVQIYQNVLTKLIMMHC
jgi:ATP adenylyltransferase/5',5'''-P-1,P-4-tetraphosphate phosphorylase II